MYQGWVEGACDCTPSCLLGLVDCCRDYLLECSIGRQPYHLLITIPTKQNSVAEPEPVVPKLFEDPEPEPKFSV